MATKDPGPTRLRERHPNDAIAPLLTAIFMFCLATFVAFNVDSWGVALFAWCLLALAAVGMGCAGVFLLRPMPAGLRCARCRYNLRESKQGAPCSECGHPVGTSAPPRRRRVALAVFILLLAAAIGGLCLMLLPIITRATWAV